MTTEVAVLNKSGIALAADSAVTISSGNQSNNGKVYNTVNKIFMLSKHHPVGVMVYGNADVNGIPWETLIKVYRKKLGDRSFSTVREYADDFLSHLMSSRSLIDDAHRELFLTNKAHELCNTLIEEVTANLNEEQTPKDQIITRAAKIAEGIIAFVKSEILKSCDTKRFDIQIKSLTKTHSPKFLDVIKVHLEKIYDHIDPESINELIDSLCHYFYSNYTIGSDSGIVISGFGDDEIFPQITSLRIQGFFENTAKYYRDEDKSFDEGNFKFDDRVIPFAMADMIHAFMTGIDPEIQGFLSNRSKELLDDLSDQISSLVTEGGADDRISPDAVRQLIDATRSNFFEELTQFQAQNHIAPVTSMLQFLPKDELAEMAETLVSLIAFKKKVTSVTESVGGPIDVAIITKGDGFVWIKRKYYFDPKLNQHYLSNYNRD